LVFGFFNYTLKESIMVSYIMVFGGTIGNYMRFGLVRHDSSRGPTINYDIALISFPMLAIGAVYGETFKTFLSDPIIGATEGGVLVFAGWRTWLRFR